MDEKRTKAKESATKRKCDADDQKKAKKSRIRYDPDKKVQYHFNISQEEWNTIEPDDVIHKDRVTQKLKNGWTHFIIEKLWKNHQIPCPFFFRNHKFPKKVNSPFVKFTGGCHECGNSISGHIEKDLPLKFPLILAIETYDTKGLLHLSNTNLAGERREEERKRLVHKKPKRHVDEKADDVMNDSGSKPPYYISKPVASTVRTEAIAEEIGTKKYPGDTITAILAMKKDHVCIREFWISPLIIYYWLENQITLWNIANNSGLHFAISIDATGSVVRTEKIIDDWKSATMFLYNIAIRIGEEIFSVCQMISSKHDNETIRDWLLAWLRSGASSPYECVVDCSFALLIAVCKAFNLCHYLKYLNDCHLFVTKKSTILPVCWVRRDRAHLIKACCTWACFTGDNWTKKDFFIRAIAYSLEVQELDELSEVILALFVVCQSEFIDVGSVCHEKFSLLEKKIADFHLKTVDDLNSDNAHSNCQPGSCSLLNETDSIEQSTEPLFEGTSIQIFVKNLQSKSDETRKDQINCTDVNNYYLPSIVKNLIILYNQYPSWTNIMLKHYSTSHGKNKVATSTASEIYYRILKIDYELHCVSLKRMLLEHIKLLQGATKNGRLAMKVLESRIKEKTEFPAESNLLPVEAEKFEDSELCLVINPVAVDKKSSTNVKSTHVPTHIKSVTAPLQMSKISETTTTVMNFQLNTTNNSSDYLVIFAHYFMGVSYLADTEVCSLTMQALLSLDGRSFIRGEIIDAIMAVFKRNHAWQDVFMIPTCQTNFIVGDSCGMSHGEQWDMYHIQFHFYGIVFLPYCWKLHWRLLMLNVRERKIHHFDPLPCQNEDDDKTQQMEKNRAINALLQFFKKCRSKAATNRDLVNNLAFIDWIWSQKIEPVKDLPMQEDGYNCGPLIIYYMSVLSGIGANDVANFDRYRHKLKRVLITEYDSVDLTCIYCYNRTRTDKNVRKCITCARWAHLQCLETGIVDGKKLNKKVLSHGRCEVCSLNL